MCGRYASARSVQDLAVAFGIREDHVESTLAADWNVAPTKPIYAVLDRGGGRNRRPDKADLRGARPRRRTGADIGALGSRPVVGGRPLDRRAADQRATGDRLGETRLPRRAVAAALPDPRRRLVRVGGTPRRFSPALLPHPRRW